MPPSNLTHASARAVTRPKYGATRMLARIEPHTPGYDMRTFECPACGHSESAVVHFGGVGSDSLRVQQMLTPHGPRPADHCF
jgi:hypothetical protein